MFIYRPAMELRKTVILKKNMMDTLPKERYDPPVIEVLQVAVETGFATSDTESGLPDWDKEDGYWQ